MTTAQPFTRSADGTEIHAADYGVGKPIVVVHGGMNAAKYWQDTGDLLAPHWRLVVIERRVYGLSGTPKMPHSMAREAEDISAVLTKIGEPAIVVGHSSGAVATLEAALTHPPMLRGILLYEPPIQLDTPLGGNAQPRMEAALARGDADTALKIFFSDLVQLPPHAVEYMSTSPEFAGGWGEMKRLGPAQAEDNSAIRALPLGIARFRGIDVPALLLRGEDSPKHLHDRLDALKTVLPTTSEATLTGEGHTANLTAPDKLAAVIDKFAYETLG
jgi:pimeloyl-ACP methyl ester carboxylesterase